MLPHSARNVSFVTPYRTNTSLFPLMHLLYLTRLPYLIHLVHLLYLMVQLVHLTYSLYFTHLIRLSRDLHTGILGALSALGGSSIKGVCPIYRWDGVTFVIRSIRSIRTRTKPRMVPAIATKNVLLLYGCSSVLRIVKCEGKADLEKGHAHGHMSSTH